MPWPAFIAALPGLDTPFDPADVSMRALRGPDGLAVFFTFHRDFDVPMHSHGPQWGVLIHGQARLTIGDRTRSYGPGDTWDIPAGVLHGGRIAAGTELIDVFAEADRYPLRPQP